MLDARKQIKKEYISIVNLNKSVWWNLTPKYLKYWQYTLSYCLNCQNAQPQKRNIFWFSILKTQQKKNHHRETRCSVPTIGLRKECLMKYPIVYW
jgi:hypothetical protein